MAKNRVMQAKNAKVRKEDMLARREKRVHHMSVSRSLGEMETSALEQIGYKPCYNKHGKEISRHGKTIIKEYKTKAKTALMARL